MLIQINEMDTGERKSSYLILQTAILPRVLREVRGVRKTFEMGSGDAFNSCEVLSSLLSSLTIL